MVELLLAGDEAVLIGPHDDVHRDGLAVEVHARVAVPATVTTAPRLAGAGAIPFPAAGLVAAVNDRDARQDLGDDHSLAHVGVDQEQGGRAVEGEGLAGPLEASGLFPDAAVQMMRVGETTTGSSQRSASQP